MTSGGITSLRIAVPRGWHGRSPAEQRSVQAIIARYLDELAESLEIPVQWRPEVEEDAALDASVVRIGNGELSLWASIAGFGNPTPTELAWSAVGDVARNVCRALAWARTRLLDTAIVERIWSTWPDSAITSELEVRRWLLEQALRVGLRLGRIDEGLRRAPARVCDRRDAERWFEGMLQGQGPGTLQLLLPRALFERSGQGAGLARGFGADVDGLARTLDLMGEGLFFELGIRIGMNSHATLEPDAAPDECRIRVNDLLLPAFRPFGPGEFLVRAGPANLSSKGLSGRQWNVPVTGGDCADVYLVRGGRRELEACRAAGWVTWGPIGWCVLQLAAAARAMAGAFVMPDVMALWITQLRLVVPQLVDAALGATGRDVMTAAMRMLAEEGVTLRDQRELLEAFASEVQPLDVDTAEYVVYSLADSTFAAPSVSGSAAMDPVAWSDLLRRRLKRSISHRAARGGLRLDAVLVHPSIENRLLAQGAIDPADAQRLAAHALEALRGATEAAGPPVLLCGARVRRLLRDALYVACPGLPVLAFEELHPEQDVRPFARIEVEG